MWRFVRKSATKFVNNGNGGGGKTWKCTDVLDAVATKYKNNGNGGGGKEGKFTDVLDAGATKSENNGNGGGGKAGKVKAFLDAVATKYKNNGNGGGGKEGKFTDVLDAGATKSENNGNGGGGKVGKFKAFLDGVLNGQEARLFLMVGALCSASLTVWGLGSFVYDWVTDAKAKEAKTLLAWRRAKLEAIQASTVELKGIKESVVECTKVLKMPRPAAKKPAKEPPTTGTGVPRQGSA